MALFFFRGVTKNAQSQFTVFAAALRARVPAPLAHLHGNQPMVRGSQSVRKNVHAQVVSYRRLAVHDTAMDAGKKQVNYFLGVKQKQNVIQRKRCNYCTNY